INQTQQTVKENIGSIIIWVIGTYSVEHEDNNIKLVMFILVNPNDKNPDNCAIFEKNEHYAISGKIMPKYYHGTKRPK
ncbi:4361_t:CDS:1, partial [Cetraspora pellucida]